MYIKWTYLVLLLTTMICRTHSMENEQVLRQNINLKQLDQIRFQDGKVNVLQDQDKSIDFYVTPFPHVLPRETECREDFLSDRTELALKVSLFTTKLIDAVKNYLYNNQSKLCGSTTLSFKCRVSLVPIVSVRIVDRTARTNYANNRYTFDHHWQTHNLQFQMLAFSMYLLNMTACEHIRKTLVDKCRLTNFEIEYLLDESNKVHRQLEITTEHARSTKIYREIRSQFPSEVNVVLNENDFKQLVNQTIEASIRRQQSQDKQIDIAHVSQHLQAQLSNSKVC